MMASPTSDPKTPNESKGRKRMGISSDAEKYNCISSPRSISYETKRQKSRVSLGISDLQNLDFDRFGSVGKDMKEHLERRVQKWGLLFPRSSLLSKMLVDAEEKLNKQDSNLANRQACHNVNDLEDNCVAVGVPVIVLSDDEDEGDRRPSYPVHKALMQPSAGQFLTEETMVGSLAERSIRIEEKDSIASEPETIPQIRRKESLASKAERTIQMKEGESLAIEAERTIQNEGKEHLAIEAERTIQMEHERSLATEVERTIQMEGKKNLAGESETTIEMEERQSLATEAERRIQMEEKESLANEVYIEKDKGVYVGVEENGDNQTATVDDGLQDIWLEMKMALECSKDVVEDYLCNEHIQEDQDCDHSFILKDDIGYVCRICGFIKRGIETIIEVQFNKVKRSSRTYMYDSRKAQGKDSSILDRVKLSENDMMVSDIGAHPRHKKQMKPHQLEGFNFLRSNLVTDNPGGCILAHAPGSGKTFMIISFIQSFLAKYPHARPLVVLPKGILATWKKEFQTWQIEDIPLFDFYSLKADSRAQQLEVLNKWVEQKSILFLGYKQLSSIICDTGTSKVAAACREILLKQPSILILDEGHNPRNEDTDMLQSLARVETPRKVVLSGTLYQNHVKEVFNILNLVRPKFLKLDTSRAVVKRIMSRVHISCLKKQCKGGADAAFYELVEHSLLDDEDFKRKVTVIQDLREMTSKVLHYYKGDSLDELPGLVDFTVVLNLSSKQKIEVSKLNMLATTGGTFKICSVGSSVLLHPILKSLPDKSVPTDVKMDEILENMVLKDGTKAKFFVKMLNLCESAGEKLLVFCQYLPPLKFLERLVVKMKGWSLGQEIFVISGESSAEHREWSMEHFNKSPHSRVFFGSIKACGEGISLVGASRVIILDVHLNPSVTRQAIGRAFRPGQEKKVYAYRLVSADTYEERYHAACFKKELISRMWFEWNEYCGHKNFEMETVDVNDCGDPFLDSPLLREDIRALYRR